ncbi:MAG: hypothetical protein ACLFUB_07505 [Cyclobacteriaceae bacterium]
MVDINLSSRTKQQVPSVPFIEVQKLRQLWIWMLIAAAFALLTGMSIHQWLLSTTAENLLTWPSVLFAGSVLLLLALFLYKSHLLTGIDKHGIYFRFFPLQLRYHMLRWEEIEEAYVREYDALSDYGGWGIKYGSHGKAYTVRGKYGLQLDLKDGRSILLGTQKPIEMERQILRFFHDYEVQ